MMAKEVWARKNTLCVYKNNNNNKMMTECGQIESEKEKAGAKFKTVPPPCFVCNRGNCGYRVISGGVSWVVFAIGITDPWQSFLAR